MADSTSPLTNSLSRVYLIEGRARPDHTPSYEYTLKMGGVSQGFGDIERIEVPDPDAYGSYIEVGSIKGASERPTTNLQGHFPLVLKSKLLRLANNGCPMDVQLHMGDCEDPRDPTAYKKVLIFENASISNYSTEDLSSLQQSDNAAVNETAELSGKTVYEITPMTFTERAGSIVTNEVLDIIVADSKSCGSCTTESDGCSRIYALTTSAGGSPSTPADIVFSIDGGTTWYAHDIDSMLTAEVPSAIAVVGAYLVVVASAPVATHYTTKASMNGYTDPAFTKVTTGLVGGPTAIKSVGGKAFIVGTGGYIYLMTDPTAGVTVLDAGTATSNALLAVDALSDKFAVAVGGNSAIVKTSNGTAWSAVAAPTGVAINYNCVAVKSTNEWWIGTSTGKLYYTLDGGTTWAEKTFSGSGSGVVRDIIFVTDSVGYFSHSTAAPRGRIFRTIDGGRNWILLPESIGSMPLQDRFTAIAGCKYDPDFLAAGGLADNGTDGIIVTGDGQ